MHEARADTGEQEERAALSGCILKALKIPLPVAAAVASLYAGVSIKPPVSVGEKTLQGVLKASAEEIKALTEALLA